MALTDVARERAAAAKVKAAEAGALVVPVVAGAAHKAMERGEELRDSELAREAKRRASAVVLAAKGEIDVTPARSRRRRLPLLLGLIVGGAGVGMLLKKLLTGATPPALGDTVATPETSEDTGDVRVTEGTMTGGSHASDGLAAGMSPAGAGTAAGGTPAGNTGGPGLG